MRQRSFVPFMLVGAVLASAPMPATAQDVPVGRAGAQIIRPRQVPLAERADASAPADRRRFLVRVHADAPRSRARGARIGALIGAAIGGLAGLAITNDFMDEPLVNAAGGAAAGGIVGLIVGAAVGAPAKGS